MHTTQQLKSQMIHRNSRPVGRLYCLLLTLFFPFQAFAGLSPQSASQNFWVWDLSVMPPGHRHPIYHRLSRQESASLNVEFWLEDSLYSQNNSPTFLKRYLELLPQLSTQIKNFGALPTPPSQDQTLRVLFTALEPYKKNGKTFGSDGFFNGFDQLTEAEALAQSQHSNEQNIVYLNALEPLETRYMQAVLVHEFNHLLTAPDTPSWINELFAEAAMQLAGFFTDTAHVERYLKNTATIGIRAQDYAIHYGALSLFAEFYIHHYGLAAFREQKFNAHWKQTFSHYIRWLYEQSPASNFHPFQLLLTKLEDQKKISLAPSAVLYTQQNPRDFKFETIKTPCETQKNLRIEQMADEKTYAIYFEENEESPICYYKKNDFYEINLHQLNKQKLSEKNEN